MAIIKCRECGKEVSNNNKICPECHVWIPIYNQNPQAYKKGIRFSKFLHFFSVLVLGVSMVSAFFMYLGYVNATRASEEEQILQQSIMISSISIVVGGLFVFCILKYMAVSIDQRNELLENQE